MSWKEVELNSLTLPPMRSKAACDVLGLKWYVFGGLGAGKLPTLWSLDIASMRWEMGMLIVVMVYFVVVFVTFALADQKVRGRSSCGRMSEFLSQI